MRGFGKRLALCLLLLSLLVTTVSAASLENCPGACSHQAAIGTTHYDTLQEAVTAAPEGSTVTLLTNVTGQKALFIDKAMVLDLGGKTLSGSNGRTEGLLNVTRDFTIQNGTLTTTAGACLLADGCNLTISKTARLQASGETAAVIFVARSPIIMSANQSEPRQWIRAKIGGQLSSDGSYPTVAIASSGNFGIEATFDKDVSITSRNTNAIEMYGSGKLTITGGTFRAKGHAIALEIPEKEATEASVTGGNFTTEADTIFIKKADDATAPGGFVTGGTYNHVPTQYVPAHCQICDNSNGTWTVIPGYTLTFRPNGGSGTMSPISVKPGESLILPACGFTAPQGQVFRCWEIGGVQYNAGATYTPESSVTVKALWKAHEHTGGKATCRSKAVCSICGETYGMLGGHALKSVGAYAPTCTADGMSAHKRCSTCGKRFVNGESISLSALSMPALGHFWQEEPGTPATCQQDGIKAHGRCANCGSLQADGTPITEEELVIPAGGHVLETVEKVDATCTQAGTLAHQHCTVCDLLLVNDKPVAPAQLATGSTSHVLSDWLSDKSGHWKTCVDCGEEFRRSGHTFDADGNCSDCGYSANAPAEKDEATDRRDNFSWLFLIPIAAAVGIAGFLAISMLLKSRK